MSRMRWRRTLSLLLQQQQQQQQRSLLPPLAASSRSSPTTAFSGKFYSRTATPWALSTREAHSSSRDRHPGGFAQGGSGRIGDDWDVSYSRRSFHATGVQHMARQNFYETLGLQKGASAKEIKSAYYQLAKKWHPDVNKGNADAEKKFQEIQQAYEVLKDDEKRAMYDQVGHEAFEQAAAGGGPDGSGGFEETIFGDSLGFEDVFSRVFGGSREGGRQHAQVQLDLTFMEAVQGCSKVVSFQTSVRCHSCDGSGLPPGVESQPCRACKGRGRVVMQKAFFTFESTCPSCGGSGQKVKDHCRSCEGVGVVMGTREVKVDIPAGVDTGSTLKVHGEGGEGPKGGRPGNLLLQIRVQPDKVFRREGANIYVDVPIPFTQAILGGSVQVPTLAGDVLLKIRPGTQPGHKQVMRGKGVKVLNSRHYGDQFVLIVVSFPSNITQRQRQLIEEFAREDSVEADRAAAAESSG